MGEWCRLQESIKHEYIVIDMTSIKVVKNNTNTCGNCKFDIVLILLRSIKEVCMFSELRFLHDATNCRAEKQLIRISYFDR